VFYHPVIDEITEAPMLGNPNSPLSGLVSSDEYDMGETLTLSLIRTGDRLLGFLTGMCFLAAAWTAWHFM
jgi:hypothetical protein